ncbi:amidohydrolase family protein [Janibacter sp. G349]|uniref:amidohydrolase family protein n=2 Tax=Janibacter TaxID=53457 RepID=UPI0020CF0B0F|nr:amidohydrolase family protein [Janibacter sp. CX7]UTT66812.1 amidohydrolase family protein [Janibacter sp. CX7]
MLDGHTLVDAHVHLPVLPTLSPSWIDWARQFGPEGLLERAWDADGVPRPAVVDELFAEQGVDVAILFCEYSPKATGMQLFDDLLPVVEHNPQRFRPMANVNPHLHFPLGDEVRRQLGHGAAGLKLHPVHGGFTCDDPMLYPAYQVLCEEGAPLVVHCGTSTFAGSSNQYADPSHLLAVTRDFPELDIVLAHGGRGWWYEQAAFMALSNPHVWIELSGLPPKRLPQYYAASGLERLARKMIFATDWPGVPGTDVNARAVADLVPDEDVPAVLGGNALRIYKHLTEAA